MPASSKYVAAISQMPLDQLLPILGGVTSVAGLGAALGIHLNKVEKAEVTAMDKEQECKTWFSSLKGAVAAGLFTKGPQQLKWRHGDRSVNGGYAYGVHTGVIETPAWDEETGQLV